MLENRVYYIEQNYFKHRDCVAINVCSQKGGNFNKTMINQYLKLPQMKTKRQNVTLLLVIDKNDSY